MAASSGYSGGTTVAGGLLQAGNNAAWVRQYGALTVNTGGTADVHGYRLNVGALSGGGAIDNLSGSGSLTFGNGGGSSTFSGTIKNAAGRLSLTKTGSGRLVLSGTNTFSGDTLVNGGSLVVVNAYSLPNGTNLTVGGSSLLAPAAADAVVNMPPLSDRRLIDASPEVVSPVPEPGAIILVAAALVGMAGRTFSHAAAAGNKEYAVTMRIWVYILAGTGKIC